jgi:hypothetical protein
MKFALALAAALIATPAAAQSPVKPTALLFNGLAQYQPGILTPLAALASDLRNQGWRVGRRRPRLHVRQEDGR